MAWLWKPQPGKETGASQMDTSGNAVKGSRHKQRPQLVVRCAAAFVLREDGAHSRGVAEKTRALFDWAAAFRTFQPHCALIKISDRRCGCSTQKNLELAICRSAKAAVISKKPSPLPGAFHTHPLKATALQCQS